MAKAPDETRRQRLLSAIGEAYKGRKLGRAPQTLRDEIAKVSGNVPLKLRLGLGAAQDIKTGIELAENEESPKPKRIEIIEALGNTPEALDALLRVAKADKSHSVRKTALQALQNFDEPRVAQDLLATKFPKEEGVRARALDLLTRRPGWSQQLIAAVQSDKVSRDDVPFDAVQRIRLHDAAAAQKIWGAVRQTNEDKQKRMREVAALLSDPHGDAIRGKQLFTQSCGICHKLHGEGASIAPDLTGYERDNLQFWLLAIVDPSAGIREEYTNFELDTTDGLLLTGFIVERGADSVTIEDGEQGRVAVSKARIKSMKASPTSRMPEGLLDSMSEREIQDLFAYLRSPGALTSSAGKR